MLHSVLTESKLWYPPPRVVPHPLSFPGGGGASLGQPKIFRCGSLCCCAGGCVVGHYHLHPLHSWQDILLTFTEMELDNTTMFPPGTSVMFIRSTGEPVLAQVIGHSEHGDAYHRISYDRDGKTVLHLASHWSPWPRRRWMCVAVLDGREWLPVWQGGKNLISQFICIIVSALSMEWIRMGTSV